MDQAYLSPIVASFAAAPQVAQRQAAERAGRVARAIRRARMLDAEGIERPIETPDAVDAIGQHGDDARRRDERAGPPKEPAEDTPGHVDVVA